MYDHIAIEVVNGQVVVSVSFGATKKVPERITSLMGYVPGGVNDGLWHRVKIQLKEKVSCFYLCPDDCIFREKWQETLNILMFEKRPFQISKLNQTLHITMN